MKRKKNRKKPNKQKIPAPGSDRLFQAALNYEHARNFPAAITLYRQALDQRPDDHRARYHLAICFYRVNELEQSASELLKYLDNSPDDFRAMNVLGNIYDKTNQIDKAVNLYQRSIGINPDYEMAYNNLGVLYNRIGEYGKAVENYNNALRIKPDYYECRENLGDSYKDQGKFELAIDSYRKALELSPKHTKSWYQISLIKHYEVGDPDIDVMVSSSKDYLPPQSEMFLSFALAKAHEDTGKYDEAFEYLKRANQIMRKSFGYNSRKQQSRFSMIKSHFNQSLFNSARDCGREDELPVFVLGMPRSGTSLAEQILASHSQVFGAGEQRLIARLMPEFLGIKSLDEIEDGKINLDSNHVNDFADRILANLKNISHGERFVVDKMPHNFLYIGFIKLLLPKARIIHCMRSPMDNCLSIYKYHFSGSHPYAYKLEELGEHYLVYRDLMAYWHELFPSEIYDIQYEDLVSDQETEIRKLLEYCDLPWEDACMEFHKTERSVTTASANQVRQPIYNDSVDRWKRYERQLEPLTRILEPII